MILWLVILGVLIVLVPIALLVVQCAWLLITLVQQGLIAREYAIQRENERPTRFSTPIPQDPVPPQPLFLPRHHEAHE